MSIYLAILMFIISGMSAMANDQQYSLQTYEVNRNSSVSENFLKKEENANETYNMLLDSFKENKDVQRSVVYKEGFQYTVDGLGSEDYPEYYSGAYINVLGDLVVRVSEKSAQQKNFSITKESDVLAKAENVYYHEAKYSYSELIDTMTSIYNYCESESYKKSEFKINGYEIRDDLNCVVVYISSVDEQTIEEVKKHVPQETIQFELKKNSDAEAFSINCGAGIGLSSGNLSCSAGYRAKYTNSSGNVVNGIITCAHGFSSASNGAAVYASAGKIGTLNKSKYQLSGKVDAVFITLSGSDMTNTVQGTSNTVSKTNVIAKATGGIIYKRGITTGNTTGTVVSASYTSTDSGNITLTDTVRTTNKCLPGDSGGINYSELTEGTGVYYVTGITCRYFTDTKETIYCKAHNINNALGVSIR